MRSAIMGLRPDEKEKGERVKPEREITHPGGNVFIMFLNPDH